MTRTTSMAAWLFTLLLLVASASAQEPADAADQPATDAATASDEEAAAGAEVAADSPASSLTLRECTKAEELVVGCDPPGKHRYGDKCVRIRIRTVGVNCTPAYSAEGTFAFINIFSAAAAQGVENATIRAMNSTKVCPSTEECKQDEEPATAPAEAP